MTAHFTLPRPQALDSSGDPVSGAKLYFFDENSTNPRTVYDDYGLSSGGAVFKVADADGLFDPIYPPVGNYDVLMTDGLDIGNDYTQEVAIRPKITTQGPVDLSSFQTNSAKSETPAITTASNYTIVETDRGKALDVNPNSATVTITLESAAVAGDGAEQTFKHIGTSNAVLYNCVNGENVDGLPGGAIVRPGGSVTIRANGANWKKKSETLPNTAVRHVVTERTLVSPPASPSAGSMYIMPDGTLTGLWSSYSTGDLIVYLGTAGYQIATKVVGDSAYLIAEGFDTVWDSSDWNDFSNTIAPQASILKTALFEVRKDSGLVGGTSVTDAWTNRRLNHGHPDNNIDGLTIDLTTNLGRLTIPAGDYLVFGNQIHANTGYVRVGLKSVTTSKNFQSSNVSTNAKDATNANVSDAVPLQCVVSLDAEEEFEFSYYRTGNYVASDLGGDIDNGDDEIYASLLFIDLSSLQGPQGVQGIQGVAGADGADGADGAPGADGTNGTDGADGVSNFYSQEAEPGGNDGDIWLKSSTGLIYIKASGTWTATATNLTGPQGIQGIQGPAGADGAGAGDLISTNNLSDLDNVVTARTNLGLGNSGATAGSYTNTNLTVDALGRITSASNGSGGSGGTSSDLLMLALRVADLEGDTLGVIDGIADPFDDETDVDTANSTGEYYDAANDLYSNVSTIAAIPGATGTAIGDMTARSGLASAFDGNTNQGYLDGAAKTGGDGYVGKTYSPGQKISSVDVYSSNNFGYASGTSGDMEITLYGKTGAAPGSATDGTLLGTTGTFSDSNTLLTKSIASSDMATAFDHVWVRITDTNNEEVRIAEVVFNDAGAGGDMTLVSNAFTADSVPSSARLLLFIKPIDAITINTDAIGAISRDGGTTFTNATLAEVAEYSDGTKVFEAASTTISGQPSGTSMKWKLTTANSKSVEVTAALLQWS